MKNQPEKMRKSIFILIGPILFSCSNLSPNKYQVKSTMENMQCFEQLVNEISSDEQLISEIIQIRESKMKGSSDPMRVDQNFRLIEAEEMKNLLSVEWKGKCLKSLKADNDFRGLRYINKDSIIIEIDRLERLAKYSRKRTMEIHRIIISKGKIKNKSYKFGGEKIMFLEHLDNGWIYEISQT